MALFNKNKQASDGAEKKTHVDEQFQHIAFIMDGNGRWAKKRGMPREYGHKVGASTFKKISLYCGEVGFRAVTVYAFSTENWKRPEQEVDALMNLMDQYLDEFIRDHDQYRSRFRFIGDLSFLSDAMREKVKIVEGLNSEYPLILNVAVNYGGRAEIVNACNTLLAEGKTSITEADVSRVLYTAETGDPDMIVRTGGDLRISNFLLWQAAYTELYFTEKLWPDLTEADIDEIVHDFYSRKRRYGGL